MPHVKLFGNPHATRAVEIPSPSGKGSGVPIPPADSEDPGDGRHRRAVFACLRELEVHFDTAGITEADYWEAIKKDFSISSRSALSDSEWARLSATLNACRRDPELFNRLVAKVKAHTAEAVPVEDASPLIFADPEDTIDTCFVIRRDRTTGTEKVIFVGEFSDDVSHRCQEHADKTRCIVQLFHAGQKPQPFFPLREGCSPV